MQYVLLWSPVLLFDRLVCMPCSGQIGFMICSKKAADGSALDTRVPRQPPPQRGDYPPLRCAGIHCCFGAALALTITPSCNGTWPGKIPLQL